MPIHSHTFFTRTFSAGVFAAVLLSCVWLSFYSFAIFFMIIGLVGLYEFYNLSEKLQVQPHRIMGYVMHLLTTLFPFSLRFIFHNKIPDFLPLLLIILCFLLFAVELFSKNHNFTNVAYTFVSWLYVSLPCYFLILIANDNTEAQFAPHKVLGCIFYIWTNDTGAYLLGSLIGKHKLYEAISPNKTWEGAIGGMLLALGLAFLMCRVFPQLSLFHWIAVSIIVSIAGIVGDLVKSMLKRQAGVKDTGNILPGHGGILDRFDSLFFSAPLVFCYLTATGCI